MKETLTSIRFDKNVTLRFFFKRIVVEADDDEVDDNEPVKDAEDGDDEIDDIEDVADRLKLSQLLFVKLEEVEVLLKR